ncbi:MAG: VOC family protein [bacterium]|nr:hypothetical protein [Gammaproteobacteria bacterium]
MPDVVSKLLKINVRARSLESAKALLCDVLGANELSNRGNDTIGDFTGSVVSLGGVMFDIVVPDSDEAPLAKVIEKHGEGIDSICFSVDDMDHTQMHLRSKGIEFSRLSEFHNNKVAFVHPREANGIALEFIQGPVAEE